MGIFRNLMDSGRLSAEECDALEYAHELALDDLISEAQYTQEEAERLREEGMLN